VQDAAGAGLVELVELPAEAARAVLPQDAALPAQLLLLLAGPDANSSRSCSRSGADPSQHPVPALAPSQTALA
jgi:hypothetical protein